MRLLHPGAIFLTLDFDLWLDHARNIHKLSESEKEKLHSEYHDTKRDLLPERGNRGLKMLLVLVCPHFVAEKSLSKDAKCGRHLEAMMVHLMDDAFNRLAWLFYELTQQVADPKLVHITLCTRIVCVERFPYMSFCMCAFGRMYGTCSI